MVKDGSRAWKLRHQRWLRFARANLRAVNAGKAIPPGPSARPLVAPGIKAVAMPAWKALVCSPHPDDEALIGALAVRMRLESGAAITNCAITFGSNLRQRARRRRELESACRVLGFNLVVAQPPHGFDSVNLDNRKNRPAEWSAKVQALSEVLEREKPDVVFAPHADDFNTTHIGTHYLVVDALGAYLERSGRGPMPFIETEFWHQHSHPNLMVGVSPDVEAILIMATAEHGGEVRRNPYHLRHPSRMIENVRLGAEVVGGQGGQAPDFPFAELYRVAFVVGKVLVPPRPGGLVIGPSDKIDLLDLVKTFYPLEGQ